MKMQKQTGSRTKTKKLPQGYSWTTVFFGAFVPLIRGMPVSCVAKLWIVAIFTLGLSNIYFAFGINEEYEDFLLDEGYKPLV